MGDPGWRSPTIDEDLGVAIAERGGEAVTVCISAGHCTGPLGDLAGVSGGRMGLVVGERGGLATTSIAGSGKGG